MEKPERPELNIMAKWDIPPAVDLRTSPLRTLNAELDEVLAERQTNLVATCSCGVAVLAPENIAKGACQKCIKDGKPATLTWREDREPKPPATNGSPPADAPAETRGQSSWQPVTSKRY